MGHAGHEKLKEESLKLGQLPEAKHYKTTQWNDEVLVNRRQSTYSPSLNNAGFYLLSSLILYQINWDIRTHSLS